METRQHQIYRITILGSIVNALLIVLKFGAGILGRSSAMIADAVHSLTDFVTDIIVLVFVRISGRPGDSTHRYGHGKFETMATVIIGLILALAGIGLMYEGSVKVYQSLHGQQLPQPTWIALVVAIISIVSKEALYHATMRVARRTKSDACAANAWHHRSDAFSSVGTLIGIAGAMFLGARWRILDPLAAIVVSIFIIKSAYDIMRPGISELLESSLPESDISLIRRTLLHTPGIADIHHLRTRKIGNNIAIDVHALMDGTLSLTQAHAIATQAERSLRAHYGPATLITIHMEPTP